MMLDFVVVPFVSLVFLYSLYSSLREPLGSWQSHPKRANEEIPTVAKAPSEWLVKFLSIVSVISLSLCRFVAIGVVDSKYTESPKLRHRHLDICIVIYTYRAPYIYIYLYICISLHVRSYDLPWIRQHVALD